MRKEALITGEIHHVFTRSIAGFEIFRAQSNYKRFVDTLSFYNQATTELRFSKFLELLPKSREKFLKSRVSDPLVQIIAYCVMPTHPHLILKQLKEHGISIFMKNALDSFTRYFNTRYKRKGPLWESKFKNILVQKDEQLLHLTRYIHLNPTSAGLVDKPEEWQFSSYNQFINNNPSGTLPCNWDGILDIEPAKYQKFVNDRISYQRSLAQIKKKNKKKNKLIQTQNKIK